MPGWFQISVRLGLVLGIAAAVLTTAALVHVPWSLAARRNVTELALTLNTEQIGAIGARMSGLLDGVAATQQAITDIVAEKSIDDDHDSALGRLFSAFLGANPTLSSIEFVRLDRRSIAVRRDGSGVLVTTVRGVSASDTPFWFKQAFEQPGASWSDIYPLSPAGDRGFTIVSVLRDGSRPLGVIAVSMALARVSDVLGDIKSSAHTAIFLTNGYREVVAVRNGPSINIMPVRGTRILKLSEAGAPSLQLADDALTANKVSLPALAKALQLRFAGPHGRYFVTFSPLSQMGFVVGLVVPESDVLGQIDRNTGRLGLALAGFVALIAVVVTVLASRTLAKPIAAVTEKARMLGDFRLEATKPVSSVLKEVSELFRATEQMRASLASFKKYIPTEVVRTLFAQGIEAELGGERRQLTIFFMDLVNFTGLSEELGDSLIPFLGEYLSEMSGVVKGVGGTIDKYIGDAVMAFWGAPVPDEDHAIAACRAALACQARLRLLRESSQIERRTSLRARIGLNTGNVLVGNIGSRERLNYTVIGDPVNVASRLESLNKRYDTEILIGEDTYKEAKDHIIARRLDRVAVYGKARGMEIYELLALAGEASPDLLEWVGIYEEGMLALRERDWDEAESLFLRAIALRSDSDKPSQLMIQRIDEFRRHPPPEDWDGLLILSGK